MKFASMSQRATLPTIFRTLALTAVAAATAAAAQDTRNVTEPLFPPSCSVLTSQMAIVANGPASETAPDTARIQAALTACPAGQAVELAGAAGNFAFLTAPLNIPSGVGLIVDGGVTLFASRNREDYQTAPISANVDECGTDGPKGNGCKTLFTFANGGTNSGSGIYGYGVIDGRGYATTYKGGVDTGISWWKNADTYVSPQSQNNPIMMKFSKSTNFTLYKITLRNSPEFHVGWSGNGFTAWGVKIQAPYTAHNTDGIDPSGTNVTITNSSISDGDDDVAVGASSASSNITVSNTTTYSGHGISVGSYTQGGLNNFLVTNVNMAGTAADGNATGIRLKSAADRGGLLNNITYQNMCLKDMRHILQLNPFYNSNTGTLIPQFSNVTLQNIHFLTPTVNTLNYLVQLQGRDASHQTTLTLNNVVFDTLNASGVTPQTQYTSFTLGPGPVYPAFLQSLAGPGVTYTGTAPATTAGAYDCSSPTTFPYVVGELYLSTASATNLQTASVAAGIGFTLNAMVQPAMAQQAYSGTTGNWPGAPALTRPINFLEGTTVVGTGTLAANGSLASLPMTNVAAGTHTYTAVYPGDTNYPTPIPFGRVTVTVTGATAKPTSTALVAAPASTTYGTSTTLTATVSSTVSGIPTGQIAFMNGSTVLASVPLTGGVASTTQTLGGGANSLTAVYAGDANFTASTSPATVVNVTTATPAIAASASPTSVGVGVPTNISVALTRVGSGSNPTGSVTIVEGTTFVGTATVGSGGTALVQVAPLATGTHTYVANYSGDSNYSSATSAPITVSAVAGPTSTTLTTAGSTVYGASTTLTAVVAGGSTGVPTGQVRFVDGSTTLGTAALAAGTVSFSALLTGGNHNLSAIYLGDANYLTSTAPATVVAITPAASTAVLAASPTTIAAGASTTLTATVAAVTGGATPTGTVTFLDGVTVVKTAALDATGKAIASVALTGNGAHAITAVYAGDANYASATSAAVTVSVSLGTATALTLSAPTIYTGGVETFTATVTSSGGTPTGTVTFANGATALGTANLNAAGVATLAVTETSAGTQSITATYAGNLPGSSSAAQTLTVVAPVAITPTPASLTLAPGATGTVSLSLAPGGGFTGSVSLTCASPVTYITCSVAPSTQNLTGVSPVASTVTITVASSVAGLLRGPLDLTPNRSAGWLAVLLPLGLLGFTRRNRACNRAWHRGLLAIAVLAALATGLSGCGGAKTFGGPRLPPPGAQVVTVTATSGTVTASAPISVTVTN